MLTEIDNVQYKVQVRGMSMGTYPSRSLAEAAIFNLPADQRVLAEVVPVQQGTGKALLLG